MSDLTIFSAGSFRHVMQELIQLFKCENSMDINAVLAPAGLLRQ
jgi:molybdenum ABC transporter, periplasmic molybdate-binding protein